MAVTKVSQTVTAIYIHTYSFITQNDRTHLHKIKIQVKNTNKSRPRSATL